MARRAFTLVELLVAMSVIVLLSSLVLMAVTSISERDGVTDAAGLVRQWLMIAKNRAGRDQEARGVRLIVSPDPNNPAKTNPAWVTELQYIEAPDLLVPENLFGENDPNAPYVKIVYSIGMGGVVTGLPTCTIGNLQKDDADLIKQAIPGGLLTLSDLPNAAETGPFSARMYGPISESGPSSPFNLYSISLTLDYYPNAAVGSGTQTISHRFGVTCSPRPLLGEPTLQLPKGICIDMNLSTALTPGPTNDYDIMFAPTGAVLPTGSTSGIDGQVFLWIRDYTRYPGNPIVSPGVYDMTLFQDGGVQQVVAIRCKTGSLGQFPVNWPVGGVYPPGQDPFTFARQGATSP